MTPEAKREYDEVVGILRSLTLGLVFGALGWVVLFVTLYVAFGW